MLITTTRNDPDRGPSTTGHDEIYETTIVPAFSVKQATTYLRERFPQLSAASATAIAKDLSCHPLALATAAHMLRDPIAGATYRETLAGRLNDALPTISGYPDAVVAAILLAVESIESDPNIATYVTFLSHLDSGGVSIDLLHQLTPSLSEPDTDQALDAMATASVVSWPTEADAIQAGSVAMHRLTARILRDRADAAGRYTDDLMHVLLRLTDLLVAQPLEHVNDHTVLRHSFTVLSRLLRRPDLTSDHLHRAAPAIAALDTFIDSLDDAELSIAFWSDVVGAQERALGPDHPETIDSMSALVFRHYAELEFEPAVPLQETALAARERTLGPDHPDTLSSRMTLALMYSGVRRHEEAIALIETTLATRERTLGPEHSETLASRGNLAVEYAHVGRNAEAIALDRATLVIRERVQGAEHSDTLATRMNLACHFRDAGNYGKAIAELSDLLATCERALGADHSDTEDVRHLLAWTYRDEDGHGTTSGPGEPPPSDD